MRKMSIFFSTSYPQQAACRAFQIVPLNILTRNLAGSF